MNPVQAKPTIVKPGVAILNRIQERFGNKATANFTTEMLKNFLHLDDEGVRMLLTGKMRVTAELAEKLSIFFDGTSKEYWLYRQKKYVTSTVRSAFVDYLDAELIAAGRRIDELTLLSRGTSSDYSVELSHKIRLVEALSVIKSHITSFDNACQLESMIETRLAAIDGF